MEAENRVVIGGFALDQLIIAGASAKFGGQHFLQYANEIRAVKGHALGRDLPEAGDMVQLPPETKAAVSTSQRAVSMTPSSSISTLIKTLEAYGSSVVKWSESTSTSSE